MHERMREHAARQQKLLEQRHLEELENGGGGAGRQVLIRGTTGGLDEAQALRRNLGGYDPDEEAGVRAKKKFKRALAKLKVKRMTGAMLGATRKKRGRGKSLRRQDSMRWDHGGDLTVTVHPLQKALKRLKHGKGSPGGAQHKQERSRLIR